MQATSNTDSHALMPLPLDERIQALDVLRGFALLGIFLMNVDFMVRPLVAIRDILPATLHGLDYAAAWFIFTFVQGKFWTLFSLLFGMGFAVMMTRAERAGRDFVRPYLRRSVALLGFGLIHACLIWAGDILVMYALVAFVLLLGFRHLRMNWLWRLALLLYLVPVLTYSIGMARTYHALHSTPAAYAQKVEEREKAHEKWVNKVAVAEPLLLHGSYTAMSRQRTRDLVDHWWYVFLEGPMILGVFLFGVWLIRSGRMVKPQAHLPFFRRMLRWTLLPGILLALLASWCSTSFIPGLETPLSQVSLMLLQISSMLLCLGYLSALMLWLQHPGGARVLAWLAPAGRMALTNYLLQSLVSTWLFYGYGLGLAVHFSRAWQVVYVLLFYALQLLLSRWWLSRYRYGPMEWLWRYLTYLRRPPMRIVAASM
ncbi:DUF418 domain-containing protein [Luteibacter rhizovicinus]|nr:DUF418 domain-containing protein [Luteibacter rhizovicinus]